jgi:hypothetical protein
MDLRVLPWPTARAGKKMDVCRGRPICPPLFFFTESGIMTGMEGCLFWEFQIINNPMPYKIPIIQVFIRIVYKQLRSATKW